ncbi:Nucleolar protein 16 [Schistosoma japonicum]|nr:Nucleolar protein 16 [Schistosoma japonicum]
MYYNSITKFLYLFLASHFIIISFILKLFLHLNLQMVKKHTFNYSRNRKKLGRKEKARLKIRNPVINSAWKYGLSVKANFNRLGLAYDANEVLGITCNQLSANSECDDGGVLKNTQPRKKTSVVKVLEELAEHKKCKPVFISGDDQLFCIYNLEMYAHDDYESMSKDPKNVYQLTPKQIERLINKFKQTMGFQKYLKDKRSGELVISELFDEEELMFHLWFLYRWYIFNAFSNTS